MESGEAAVLECMASSSVPVVAEPCVYQPEGVLMASPLQFPLIAFYVVLRKEYVT